MFNKNIVKKKYIYYPAIINNIDKKTSCCQESNGPSYFICKAFVEHTAFTGYTDNYVINIEYTYPYISLFSSPFGL